MSDQPAAAPRSGLEGPSLLEQAESLALRLNARSVALANGAIIAVLGTLGVNFIVFDSPFAIFDLDGEKTFRRPTRRPSGSR